LDVLPLFVCFFVSVFVRLLVVVFFSDSSQRKKYAMDVETPIILKLFSLFCYGRHGGAYRI